MQEFLIYCGTVGWEYENWAGSFYPQDLPEDWRLAYYSSQFRCTYLPYETWHGATDEEVRQWLGEIRESFMFVLGMPYELNDDSMAKASRYGSHAVLSGKVDLEWLASDVDLRALSQRIAAAQKNGLPLYLIARPDNLGQLKRVTELMEILGA